MLQTYQVTEAITKVAESFGCKAVEGFLSHQLTKNKIEGGKAIIQNPTQALKKAHKDSVIEVNDVRFRRKAFAVCPSSVRAYVADYLPAAHSSPPHSTTSPRLCAVGVCDRHHHELREGEDEGERAEDHRVPQDARHHLSTQDEGDTTLFPFLSHHIAYEMNPVPDLY
jgi:hypothetical protein